MTHAEHVLREASKSFNVEFGTDAPYQMVWIGAARIGFAGQPSIVVELNAKSRDTSALVPIARQQAYRELVTCGINPDCLAVSPIVGVWRRLRFTDRNESSKTLGKNKMGNRLRFTFEITDKSAINVIRECFPRSYEGAPL